MTSHPVCEQLLCTQWREDIVEGLERCGSGQGSSCRVTRLFLMAKNCIDEHKREDVEEVYVMVDVSQHQTFHNIHPGSRGLPNCGLADSV